MRTLGASECQAGHWQEAVVALKKVSQILNEVTIEDAFLLAQAYGQLGQKQRAQKLFDNAQQELESTPARDDIVLRNGTDAAKVLGIGQVKAEEQ